MLTRNRTPKNPSAGPAWKLQDAKARFSEVVRRAQSEGPQRVTVHGKDAVVVLSAADYAKSQPSERTGADLVAAMQEARKLGLQLKPRRFLSPPRPPVTFSGDER